MRVRAREISAEFIFTTFPTSLDGSLKDRGAVYTTKARSAPLGSPVCLERRE